MLQFVDRLLNLLIYPFKQLSSPLVMFPFALLCVSGAFLLFVRIMHRK